MYYDAFVSHIKNIYMHVLVLESTEYSSSHNSRYIAGWSVGHDAPRGLWLPCDIMSPTISKSLHVTLCLAPGLPAKDGLT